jgi:hypothetical protein
VFTGSPAFRAWFGGSVLVREDGDPLGWAFGALGTHDRARHLATLYLNDLADVIRDAVDPRFEFVRYGERLAASQPEFDLLSEALAAPLNLVDSTLQALTVAAIERHDPQVLLVSVPFPGAVYGAFRIAQAVKALRPDIVTVLDAAADLFTGPAAGRAIVYIGDGPGLNGIDAPDALARLSAQGWHASTVTADPASIAAAWHAAIDEATLTALR